MSFQQIMASAVLVPLVSGVILLLGAERPSREEKAVQPPVSNNQAVQAQIKRAVEQFTNFRLSSAERWAALGMLESISKDDEAFFRELFYCYYQQAQRHSDTKTLTVLMIPRHLGISKSAIAKVVMPYLYAEDKTLREAAREFLEIIHESRRGDMPPDFSYYADVLKSAEPEGSEALLVRYMYETSPTAALLALIPKRRGWQEEFRNVLWAEHVVSDALWKRENGFDEAFQEVKPKAVKQLEQLSRHSAWWVRLYVAEIVARHPQLGTPEIVQRLKSDENELVRQAVTRTTDGAPERRGVHPKELNGDTE